MATRDLTAFLEDDALDYPGIPSENYPDGKTYRVKSPDARTGLWLTSLNEVGMKAAFGEELSGSDAASLQLDDDDERTFYQRILASTYGEMLADGVSWAMLQRVAQDAFLCFTMSRELADANLARAMQAASGEAVAGAKTPATATTRSTGRKPAGSSSKKASTGTRGRTPAQASTRSSTSRSGSAPKAKQAG